MIDKKNNLVAAYDQIQMYKNVMQEVEDLKKELRMCKKEKKDRDIYCTSLVEMVLSTPDPLAWIPVCDNITKQKAIQQAMPKPPKQPLFVFNPPAYAKPKPAPSSSSFFGFLKKEKKAPLPVEISHVPKSLPTPKVDKTPALPDMYMDSHIWTIVFSFVDVFTYSSAKVVCKQFCVAARNPTLVATMSEKSNIYAWQRRICKLDLENPWATATVCH
eukprot:Phypoly_transcript_18005.p1 GENE.Phypoly_transcript_18005~~Phypoly_transcript_18005.p1  ORF type:complete len:216 (+),score=41.01 Phypoly_transcript_18005:52-699(+)